MTLLEADSVGLQPDPVLLPDIFLWLNIRQIYYTVSRELFLKIKMPISVSINECQYPFKIQYIFYMWLFFYSVEEGVVLVEVEHVKYN